MNVQNAQAAAAPLPVSAQTIAKFSDLFSDANKDPLQGLYHDLFASFDIDINNAQNGVPPASLRDFIAAAGAQNLPSALGLLYARTFAQHALIEHSAHLPPPLTASCTPLTMIFTVIMATLLKSAITTSTLYPTRCWYLLSQTF